MNKQTAVEWLFQQIYGDTGHIGSYTTDGKDAFEAFEQAKAMEREQIENAWHAGVSDSDDCKSYYNIRYRATSEKYYIKTYKGGEQ